MTEQSPIAVIGAGRLGWQIALTFAMQGVCVRLHDRFPDALKRAMDNINAELADQIESGSRADVKNEVLNFIKPSEDLSTAVEGAWLVVEAIPEQLELKRAFYRELSRIVGSDVILASNSSSYKSRAFAGAASRPERLMNAHFYGRPWLRPAVELMTCGSTDPEVIERIRRFFNRAVSAHSSVAARAPASSSTASGTPSNRRASK
jgi:3-hydroxybutyryl-CoA dehydrogenase